MLAFKKTTLDSFENVKATTDGKGMIDGPSLQSRSLAQEILATVGWKEGHVTFTTQTSPDLPVQFTVRSGDKTPETGVRLVDGTVVLDNSAAIDIAQASEYGVDQARKVEKAGYLLVEALQAELRKQGIHNPASSKENEGKQGETPFKEIRVPMNGGHYFAARGAVLEVNNDAFAAELRDHRSYCSALKIAKTKLAEQGLEVLDYDLDGVGKKRTTVVLTKMRAIKETVVSSDYQKRVKLSRWKTYAQLAVGTVVPVAGWLFILDQSDRILQRHAALKNGHGWIRGSATIGGGGPC